MKRLFIPALILMISHASAIASPPLDCTRPSTTLEMNDCASIKLRSATAELNRYLKASLKHQSHDLELVTSIKTAQVKWEEYMSAHFGSVGVKWRRGTIRGVKYISCQIRLTELRTHEIWEQFLTYMDSSPPVLPKPVISAY